MSARYMHTMDGQPAQFEARGKGGCLVYCGRQCLRLARSLRQIRHEQMLSRQHYGERDTAFYGYVLIKASAMKS
jgi:hypothetical protein